MSNLVVRSFIAAAVVLSPVVNAVALPAGTRPIPQVAFMPSAPVPRLESAAFMPSAPVPRLEISAQ